ncbi:terminase small subunit [Enterococcus dongliensis]|uniref:Terminase small subunit n=1 Tax=Enterococcus dongliensis TaxID=2559925 RepID=A0ABU3EQT8_9ENTE|nr:terminase small subunit [Enterococcus dongliensis]MDT2597036.1 terminase small subunit [Enterococcus dongliensis]
MANLTTKQKAFADEYIINGGNATQAAIKAGYSQKSARAIGKQNLTKLYIKDYIQFRLKPIEEKREVTADDALNELISIWQGDTQNGVSKTMDRLKNGEIVKHIEYEYTPDLESKLKALDLYLKYKSLLSQAQLEKARTEIKLMQAKLEVLQRGDEESTEDKLDELLNRISGELDGVD